MARLVSRAVLGIAPSCPLGALFLASCTALEPERDPRLGLAASVLPNLGVETTATTRLLRRGDVDWRAELSIAQQFLDDEDLADDGRVSAGDWTQAGLGLRWITHVEEKRHWTARLGFIWARARGVPNIVNDPGDFVGIRFGLGYESDLTPALSMGPELAVIPTYGGDGHEFDVVPQLTWGFRWRP